MGLQTYIVRFKESVSEENLNKAIEDIKAKGGKVIHKYSLFKGFSASVPDDHVSTLESHPDVEGVEKDSEVKTQ